MFFARFLGWALLWFVLMTIGSGNNALAAICAVLFFPLTIYLYMMPTHEAWKLKHPDLTSIAMVNVFLGWSVIGWVVALSWAFKQPAQAAPAQAAQQSPAAVENAPSQPPAPAAATKACPFCAETILAAAVKCKHCGSDLTAQAVNA